MGWMSQLRLQQLTGWQAAGDGRGSATVEGGLVRERERSMVLDVQVVEEEKCPEAAGAQDWTWTGLD